MEKESFDDLRSFFIHPVLAVWWSRKFIQPPSTTRINNKKNVRNDFSILKMNFRADVYIKILIFLLYFEWMGDNEGIYVIKPTINWLKSNIYTQTTICGDLLRIQSGIHQFPSFPTSSALRLECSWTVARLSLFQTNWREYQFKDILWSTNN